MEKGNPAEPGTGADSSGTAAGAPGGETQPKPDFDTRIRSDPEFALDQYKKMKGENTKLFQKQQKYEPVVKLAEQYGADNVTRWLGEYDAILKHPEVKKVAEHFRTAGTLPTVRADRPESDELDMFSDPHTEQLTAVQTELGTLRSQLSQTRLSLGKQKVSGMLSQLKTECPDGFDEFIMPALKERFDDWEKSPNGRELLANLEYEQLKTVAGRAVIDNQDAIYAKKHERKLLELKRGATGVPAPNLSTGRESGPKSGGYVSAITALKEFEAAEGPLPRR